MHAYLYSLIKFQIGGWSKVGTDLFTVSGNNYITIGDYFYLHLLKLVNLRTPPHTLLFKCLKSNSVDIASQTVVLDNRPQFSSQEFHEFSLTWEFNHVTSSPHHPKSNGKAESSVKAVKQLFKKAERDGKDPWLALLA